MKSNKAPGLDNIHARTIKNIVDLISPPLCYLNNKILTSGLVPPQLETTVIKPPNKTGDKKKCSTYRPISLISSLVKIFETVIKNRIVNSLNKYNILSPRQFEF